MRRNFKNTNIMNKKRRTTGISRLTKMALTICIMLMGGTAWADDVYKKYTGDITEGDYVITCKDNNSTIFALVAKMNDSQTPHLSCSTPNVSEDGITLINPNELIVWHIAKNGDYWTLYNSSISKYASGTGTKNQTTLNENTSSNLQKFTIKYYNDKEKFRFDCKGRTDEYKCLGYTNGGWGCYDSYSICYLTLYKKENAISLSETDATLPSTNTSYDEVTLTRGMASDKWSTLCLPFALSSTEISDNFGVGAQVKTLSGLSVTDGVFNMTFEDAPTIAAGTPYLVKATKDVTTITANPSGGVAVNTTLTETATTVSDGSGNSITFQGHFGTQTVAAGNYIIKDNKFYVVGNSGTTNKGYRGYFTIAGPNANKVKALNLDEDVTGIEIVQELEQEDNTMYDLQGRAIKNPQLGHLYIMQGKKYLNKK